jgi:hypothetical protein
VSAHVSAGAALWALRVTADRALGVAPRGTESYAAVAANYDAADWVWSAWRCKATRDEIDAAVAQGNAEVRA